MTQWLNKWEKNTDGRPLEADQPYSAYSSRSSINTALRRACVAEAALPNMALYSLRHRGTTVLRITKVSKQQIDYQLGHVQAGARSTQDYGQYTPGYLSDAARALDSWIARVLRLAPKKPKAKSKNAA